MRDLLDPELLDTLDRLEGEPLESTVWRVAWASRDPLAGSSAGGRWTPPNAFEALYLSLDPDGAIAEVNYHLSKAPVFSSSHKKLCQIEVKLRNTLRLDDKKLVELGIEDARAPRIDYNITQPIGEAAHMLDYEGMLVPSARWACMNLVLFLDRIDLNTQISVTETTDINWPAWFDKNRNKLT